MKIPIYPEEEAPQELREEIEQFFLAPDESFIDQEAMKNELLALIEREKRRAAAEAVRWLLHKIHIRAEDIEPIMEELFPPRP